MEVSISHLIGTVALISFVITASLSYQIVTTYIQDDIFKQQLSQISEYVALHISEMANLMKFTRPGESDYMIRSLDMPNDLSGKAYAIQLDVTSQGSKTRAFLVSNKNIYAEALIPMNYTTNPIGTSIVLTTTSGSFSITKANSDIITINYNGTIYGQDEIIVWGHWFLDDEFIEPDYVGIGVGLMWGG